MSKELPSLTPKQVIKALEKIGFVFFRQKGRQQQIAQKITEAFALRKQSKHLLESAKRAVETAIEQNEDAAIKWLQEQT